MDHEDRPFHWTEPSCSSAPQHLDSLTRKIVEGIDPHNVSYRPGFCEIRLWTEWAQILTSLPTLGGVFVLTGNACAILGHNREYPALEFCHSFRHAHCGDGTFDLEFIPWNSASLIAKRVGNRVNHFLEFRDETNAVIHKVCVTDETDLDKFVEWVQYHQAMGGAAKEAKPFPPGRWRTVQQRHWFDYDEVEVVHPLAVKHVLQSALEASRPINVVVGNEGIVQSCTMVPKQLNPAQTWAFAGDDFMGLHFDQTALADVIIHHVDLPDGGPTLSSLKCFDDAGNLRLAITPPFSVVTDGWNDFLDEATTR